VNLIVNNKMLENKIKEMKNLLKQKMYLLEEKKK
jgi:hypothetical protein